MIGLRVWCLALALCACKTGGSEEPPPIIPDPGPGVSPSPSDDQPARPRSAVLLPPPPPMLAEPLKPVRGGTKALPPYRGQYPCRMALTGESPVAKACSEGGERQAMDLMQSFVKRARAEGFNFVCGDCHIDEDDRTKLAPQADAEFRKLLFLARPGD